jgi:TATA-box binding protein (TBP) (component of TFIID and TFIIIB)
LNFEKLVLKIKNHPFSKYIINLDALEKIYEPIFKDQIDKTPKKVSIDKTDLPDLQSKFVQPNVNSKKKRQFPHQCTFEVKVDYDRVLNVKIYNAGSIQISGCKTNDEATLAIKILLKLIKDIDTEYLTNNKGVHLHQQSRSLRLAEPRTSTLPGEATAGCLSMPPERLSIADHSLLQNKNIHSLIDDQNRVCIFKKYKKMDTNVCIDDTLFANRKIEMIRATFNIGYSINFTALASIIHQNYPKLHVRYDPDCGFSGFMIEWIAPFCEIANKKQQCVVFCFFSTGSAWLTCARNYANVDKSINFITKILEKHKYDLF